VAASSPAMPAPASMRIASPNDRPSVAARRSIASNCSRVLLSRARSTSTHLPRINAKPSEWASSRLISAADSFIAGLGSTLTWPFAARGQQAERMRRIGVLVLGSPDAIASRMPAFLQGLKEAGYVDGRTVAIEYRSAERHYDRLPALAAELVRRRVHVIFAIAGPSSVLAAKDATATIPIVFAIGEDPVKLGLVASFSRPGGNVTGVTFMAEGQQGSAWRVRPQGRTDTSPRLQTVALPPPSPERRATAAAVRRSASGDSYRAKSLSASPPTCPRAPSRSVRAPASWRDRLRQKWSAASWRRGSPTCLARSSGLLGRPLFAHRA
jgi:hypothetical protein